MKSTIMTPDDFSKFIETEMKPRTIIYAQNFIISVPAPEVPLFYFEVLTGLGMAEMPSNKRKLEVIESFEGDINAAKRFLLNEMIQNLTTK
jgi:hypothetical protein